MNPYMDPNMYPIKDPITAMGFVNHLGQKLDNLINHVHKKEVFYSLKKVLDQTDMEISYHCSASDRGCLKPVDWNKRYSELRLVLQQYEIRCSRLPS